MLDRDKLIAEWRTIRRAPLSFALATVGIIGVVWLVLSFLYSTRIEGLKEALSSKDSILADYRDKLSGATPAEARKRLDALELQVAALSPRRLTESQKISLTDIASRARNSSVDIQSDASVADSRAFTADVAKAFNLAGWKVGLPLIMGPSNPPASGVALRVTDPLNLTFAERTAKEALQEAKIIFDIQPVGTRPGPPRSMAPNLPPDADVTILVTSR